MNRLRLLFTGTIIWAAFSASARACAVCQGNPDSDLVKGAKSGVLMMILVTYGVLLCFGGFAALWFVRHRRNLRRSIPASGDDRAADR